MSALTGHSTAPRGGTKPPTLAIIDMQAGEDNARESLLVRSLKRLMKAAIKGQWGILAVELVDGDELRRPTNHGLLCLTEQYSRLRVCTKKQDNGSAEIIAACRKNGFSLAQLLIGGVNTDVCVKSTVLGLATALQDSIVQVVKDACNWCADTRHWSEMASHPRVQVVDSVEESIAGLHGLLEPCTKRTCSELQVFTLKNRQEVVRIGDVAALTGMAAGQLWSAYFNCHAAPAGTHTLHRGRYRISAARTSSVEDDDLIDLQLAESFMRARLTGAEKVVLKPHRHCKEYTCNEAGALWCMRLADGLYQAGVALKNGQPAAAGVVELV